MKRPCNERYFRFWVVPSRKISHVSWDETTPEWQRNDIGMILEWLQNDARMHCVECFRACYLNPVLVSTVFVSFSTKTFTFLQKPRVFAQVGSTLTFSLTICTALLGNSLLQRSSSMTKLVFRAIQNSSQNFLFFLPPLYLSLSSKPSIKKCQVSQDSRLQGSDSDRKAC